MMAWFAGLWSGDVALVEPATSRDAREARPAPRRIVSPRLGPSRIREHAVRAQHAGASPAAWTQDRRLCGVAAWRWGRGRGPFRSRLRRAIAAAACPARLLTHLGHLSGRGVRTVFLEVEANIGRRGGFTNGPDLLSPANVNAITGSRRRTIERASDASRVVVVRARWQNRSHGFCTEGTPRSMTALKSTPALNAYRHRSALRGHRHAHDRTAPRHRPRAGGGAPIIPTSRNCIAAASRSTTRSRSRRFIARSNCSRTPASSSVTIFARAARATSRCATAITII